jgi:hypothetical protein
MSSISNIRSVASSVVSSISSSVVSPVISSVVSSKLVHNSRKRELIFDESNKKYLFKLNYTVWRRDDSDTFKFVALASDKYEFLDLLSAVFFLDDVHCIEYINRRTNSPVFEFVDSIVTVMDERTGLPKLFYSERPVLLYSVCMGETDYTHWKYFRDGYRYGEDLNTDITIYTKNKEFKTCPVRKVVFEHSTKKSYSIENNVHTYKYITESKQALEKLGYFKSDVPK